MSLSSRIAFKFCFGMVFVMSFAIFGCGGGGGGTSTTSQVVSVTISPGSVSLSAIRVQNFTASVSGSTNTAVTWSVQEAGGGAMTSNGIYMAPNVSGTYHIIATSQADSTKTATVTVTVAPSLPRFAYSANKTDGTVSMYTVNAATGQIRANGYAVSGSSPQGVAVDPTGKFVYVANGGSNSISEFAVTSSNMLTTLGTVTTTNDPNLNSPNSMDIDPFGKYLFISNSGGRSVSSYIIGSSGTLGFAGNITVGNGPQGLTVDPSGRFVYVVNNTDNTVSALAIGGTGALSLIGTVATGTAPDAVAVDPRDRYLYIANFSSGNVTAYSIGNSGALTQVATVTAGNSPDGVTVDPTGKFAYVVNFTDKTVVAYSITNTGSLSSLGNVNTGNNPSSVKVDPTGQFAYVSNSADNTVVLYGITSNGSLTTSFSRTMRTQGGPSSIALSKGGAAVSYVPQSAYVVNFNSGDVYTYGISGTGALKQVGSPLLLGATPASTNPYSVTVDPTGRFAYVVDHLNNRVYQFNVSGGVLSPQAISYISSGGSGPISIAIDPSGQYAYVANQASTNLVSFAITSSGSLSQTGIPQPTGAWPNYVTVDPTGKSVFVANLNGSSVSGYTISLTNGTLTPQTSNPFSLGTSTNPISLTVDPTGRFLYTANYGGDVSLCPISISGALSCTSTASQLNSNESVVVDPYGKYLYVVNYTNNNIWGYSIDSTLGSLAALAGFPLTVPGTNPNPDSVTIDPSGAYLYVVYSTGGSIWGAAITSSTGALSTGMTFSAGSTPEAIVTTGIIQ